ncbi:hypothetical protein HUU62_04745 [Rhodoferax sp. 4810]|nr:hypothetical protein [Rhodoferax jenense]
MKYIKEFRDGAFAHHIAANIAVVARIWPCQAAATLWLDARVTVAKACAANSRLLCSSNSTSDGVSRLSSGEVPSL